MTREQRADAAHARYEAYRRRWRVDRDTSFRSLDWRDAYARRMRLLDAKRPQVVQLGNLLQWVPREGSS